MTVNGFVENGDVCHFEDVRRCRHGLLLTLQFVLAFAWIDYSPARYGVTTFPRGPTPWAGSCRSSLSCGCPPWLCVFYAGKTEHYQM